MKLRDLTRPRKPINDLVDVDLEADGQAPHDHDQLPSPDEYKFDFISMPKNRRQYYIKMIFIICVPVATAIALLTVGIVIATGQEEAKNLFHHPGPEGYDPNRVSNRVNEVLEFVVQKGWSNRAEAFIEQSPQWNAAAWMADFDPLTIEIADTIDFRQRYALAVFYFSFKGPAWSQELGFLSATDVCDWYRDFPGVEGGEIGVGISCDCYPGVPCDRNTVKTIFLPSLQLNGQLPTEIELLHDLLILDLYNNNVYGKLPESLKNMKIESLVVSHNSLSGFLPDWLGELSTVTTLNLASNQLIGEIPDSIKNMQQLITLNLSNNQLFGNIDKFTGIQGLQALFVDYNLIDGEFTAEHIDSWPFLEVLDLSNNMLDGTLPESLFESNHLVILDLHGNFFNGYLPEIHIDDSPLYFLALQNNTISGEIPSSLRKLNQLKHLDLSMNHFDSTIPEELGSLINLKYLFLAHNNRLAPGEIPYGLTSLGNLVDLSLKDTNRVGKIPARLVDLENLVLLDLGDNGLTGPIPTEIGAATNLRFLLLAQNRLSGEIPTQMSSLTNLNVALLDRNNFFGSAWPMCGVGMAINEFVADCGVTGSGAKEIECPCCSLCCRDGVEPCYNLEWFGDYNPVWETNYVRERYSFDEDDVSFPVTQEYEGGPATLVIDNMNLDQYNYQGASTSSGLVGFGNGGGVR